MRNAETWPHRWFGYWREDGTEFFDCPNVFDWLEPGWADDVLLADIASYLDSSPYVAATSSEPCVLCKRRQGASLVYRTDGLWYWPDTLSHYVTHHQVRLPNSFCARILGLRSVPAEDLWDNEKEFVQVLKTLDVPTAHRAMIEAFIEQHCDQG